MNFNSKALLLISSIFLSLLSPLSSQAQIEIPNLKKHIQFLSADELLGRETGRKGADQAAKYIEDYFKALALKPLGEEGYRQNFMAKVTRKPVTDSLRQASNIIAFLDNNSPQTIVIGAHYDHLGQGEFGGSLDSLGVGKIHNGADDNASGVAGLLELARHYSQNDIQEQYNILFIAFGAEELGLLGSKYFTEHPTIPLNQINWMLNMDMIGRYDPENKLAIIGYGTSTSFETIFQKVGSELNYFTSRDGKGGSDQTSFYLKDIPVLFFHTGGHPDYHRPTDDEDKINYPALKAILDLEIDVLDASMNLPKMIFQWTN